MPDKLLEELLKKATAIGPTPLDNAKQIVSKDPFGAKALEDTTIHQNNLLPSLVGKFSSDEWPKDQPRPFAASFFGNHVFLPDSDQTPETLAHELGHVMQAKNGLPIKNDNASDFILNNLRRNRWRNYSLMPRQLPKEVQSPSSAEDDILRNVLIRALPKRNDFQQDNAKPVSVIKESMNLLPSKK